MRRSVVRRVMARCGVAGKGAGHLLMRAGTGRRTGVGGVEEGMGPPVGRVFAIVCAFVGTEARWRAALGSPGMGRRMK